MLDGKGRGGELQDNDIEEELIEKGVDYDDDDHNNDDDPLLDQAGARL